jgi:acetyltransferase-like isoleucine patch superfamily enzyme
MIGAGAVVTKDIPPYSLAVGVPAKVVKTFEPEKYQQKIADQKPGQEIEMDRRK